MTNSLSPGRVRRLLRAARVAANRAEGHLRERIGKPRHILVGGYRMAVPLDMLWAYRGGAYYEQTMTYWLPRLLRAAPRRVFFDVGANHGYYSLLLADNADAVHAFEPVNATRAALNSNVAHNDITNLTVHDIALSDRRGTAEIRLFSSSGNNSLFDVETGKGVKFEGTQNVPLDTLDRQVYEGGLPVPGLIKVDVEGAELFVIRGARRLLAEHRPILTAEFFGPHFETAGYSPRELLDELTELGYAICGVTDDPGDRRLYERGDFGRVRIDNIIAMDEQRLDKVARGA